MTMPVYDRCISCGTHLSPEGWCVLMATYDHMAVISDACSLKCCLTLSRQVESGKATTKIFKVNEVTYNPLNFLHVSQFEIL